MAIDDVLAFAHQCCDAVQYLEMGERCANGSGCYDALRPLGATYWFALPFLLGVAPEWLMVWQGLLLLIAACLGGLALYSLWQRCCPVPRWGLPACLLASTLAHAAWGWPYLAVALSDLPASALALTGLWLMLWRPGHTASLAMAGLCLGLACWLRTFFLYPFFGLLAVSAIQACWRRKPALILLFTGLLPVLLQYHTVWSQTGTWSYLDSHWAAHWSNKHLEDPASGYDTVSMTPRRWYTTPCQGELQPPSAALAARDVPALVCVALGRARFYLGSYSAAPFQWYQHDNLLVANNRFKDHPDISSWRKAGLQNYPDGRESTKMRILDLLAREESRCASSADAAGDGLCRSLAAGAREGFNSLDFQPLATTADWQGSITQRVLLKAGEPYTFSALLWTESMATAVLAVKTPNGRVLTSHSLPTNDVFQFASITALPAQKGIHHLSVSFSGNREGTPGPLLLVMQPRLVMGMGAVPEPGDMLVSGGVRHWSLLLLAFNAYLLVVLLLVVARHWRTWPAEAIPAASYTALCLGMALAVVPEQRFAVPLMTLLWSCGSVALIALACRCTGGARMPSC